MAMDNNDFEEVLSESGVRKMSHMEEHIKYTPLGTFFKNQEGDYYFVNEIKHQIYDYDHREIRDDVWLRGERLIFNKKVGEIQQHSLIFSSPYDGYGNEPENRKIQNVSRQEYLDVRESIKKRFYAYDARAYQFARKQYTSAFRRVWEYQIGLSDVLAEFRKGSKELYAIWFLGGDVDTYHRFRTYRFSRFEDGVNVMDSEGDLSPTLYYPETNDKFTFRVEQNHYCLEHKYREDEKFFHMISPAEKPRICNGLATTEPFSNSNVFFITEDEYNEYNNIFKI